MSESADKQVLPADERLRRIEGELQHIKMLLTQVVKHMATGSGLNVDEAKAQVENKPQREA
jgi:hypothetical protein